MKINSIDDLKNEIISFPYDEVERRAFALYAMKERAEQEGNWIEAHRLNFLMLQAGLEPDALEQMKKKGR